jgi:hypothetical protein
MPGLKQDLKPSRKANRERAISVVFASAVVAAVMLVSFLPGGDKHRLHTSGRFHSWGHFLAFVGVALGLARTTRSFAGRALLFAGSLMLGFAIEWGEHFVYQSPLEWKDVLVDGLGVVCGTLLAIVTQPRRG